MKNFLIFIIIIAIIGLGYWLYKSTPEEQEQDEISKLLTDLKTETGIEFSEIADTEVKWNTKIGVQTVDGKGFEVINVPEEQADMIDPFFKDNDFEIDLYNVAAGTISEMAGYVKDKTGCIVIAGATGYKESEGQWIPPEPYTVEIEVMCGEIEPVHETATWQIYQNEKYGYSLKYPENCLLGPLPGYCKQSPPEERAQECRCYLNNTNSDEASLGTFTGTKSDLTGASFVVFHSIYVDSYNPPAGTDLAEWVKEKFPHQDVPDEINTQVGGIEAIKVYTPKSPMAYSQEDIYFIKDDKLFRVGILDVDNQGNRELYDNILSTFEFFTVEANCTAKTGESMGLEEAKELAVAGECEDQLKETHNCNSDTGTWWIDLDIEKEGCYPACVVNVKTKAVSINWRCTGLID